MQILNLILSGLNLFFPNFIEIFKKLPKISTWKYFGEFIIYFRGNISRNISSTDDANLNLRLWNQKQQSHSDCLRQKLEYKKCCFFVLSFNQTSSEIYFTMIGSGIIQLQMAVEPSSGMVYFSKNYKFSKKSPPTGWLKCQVELMDAVFSTVNNI